jgi:hypothetical protein
VEISKAGSGRGRAGDGPSYLDIPEARSLSLKPEAFAYTIAGNRLQRQASGVLGFQAPGFRLQVVGFRLQEQYQSRRQAAPPLFEKLRGSHVL